MYLKLGLQLMPISVDAFKAGKWQWQDGIGYLGGPSLALASTCCPSLVSIKRKRQEQY